MKEFATKQLNLNTLLLIIIGAALTSCVNKVGDKVSHTFEAVTRLEVQMEQQQSRTKIIEGRVDELDRLMISRKP